MINNYSILSSLKCSYIISVSNDCSANCKDSIMKCRQPIVQKYLCFGLTYFLVDILYMFRVYDIKPSNTQNYGLWRRLKRFCFARPLIIIHHLALPLIGFPLLLSYSGKLGDCLIGTGFIMEASTPFVNSIIPFPP